MFRESGIGRQTKFALSCALAIGGRVLGPVTRGGARGLACPRLLPAALNRASVCASTYAQKLPLCQGYGGQDGGQVAEVVGLLEVSQIVIPALVQACVPSQPSRPSRENFRVSRVLCISRLRKKSWSQIPASILASAGVPKGVFVFFSDAGTIAV